MAIEQPKDWEKEYSQDFNKKIPFPMLKYECGRMNPALDNVIYTLASASLHESTKFELYTEENTKEELDKIIQEIKDEDAKTQKSQPKPPAKKEEKKDGVDPEQDLDNPEEKKEEKKDSNNVTERALIRLQEQRANQRQAKHEEEKAKEREKDNKKKESKKLDKKKEVEEEKKDDDKSSDNEEKKDEEKKDTDFSKEEITFSKIETDDTYGQNLRDCKKILTMWEVKSNGYRKLNEIYIFDTINTVFEFSADGKFLLLACTDSKSFLLYDAVNMKFIRKMTLSAKDDNGNVIEYFYSCMLSTDGSYLVTGDSYSRYIFDIEGKFIRK